MASLILILATLYYLTNLITALPHRNVDHDYEVFGFVEENNVEETKTRKQRNLEKRAVGSGDHLTCETGATYVYDVFPVCVVGNAEYFPELELCLVKHCYVPGMPDGKKGPYYLAYKHHLYKFYNAAIIKRKRKCPERTTALTTSSTLSTKLLISTTKQPLSTKSLLIEQAFREPTPSLSTKRPLSTKPVSLTEKQVVTTNHQTQFPNSPTEQILTETEAPVHIEQTVTENLLSIRPLSTKQPSTLKPLSTKLSRLSTIQPVTEKSTKRSSFSPED